MEMNVFKNIVIVGSTGAIGSAFIQLMRETHSEAMIHCIARSNPNPSGGNITNYTLDLYDEELLEKTAQSISESAPIDLVLVATGILHEDGMMPEKSLKEITADKLIKLFTVNSVIPILCAKHFTPYMNKESSIFAALTARVGSISDNKLGGWYSYRASKSALNMLIKTCAIEIQRTLKNTPIIAIHPGTVSSKLSEPFNQHLDPSHVFDPQTSAQHVWDIIRKTQPSDTGKVFAWGGSEINP